MKTDISIIMPVFNGEHYMLQAIESIYKTIHKTTWELLMRDDRSTDNSWALMQTRVFDKRIRIFKSEKNEGAAIARNKLICEAKSDTIMILDCDNILCDGVVDRLFDIIKSGENVAAPEKLQYFTDPAHLDLNDVWDFKYLNGICDKAEMLKSFVVPPCSGNYMYRKSVWEYVNGYHEEDIQETWGFGFRHIFADFPIRILKDSQYLHRFLRDGYYGRLDKGKIDKACWRLLKEHDSYMSGESKAVLSDCRSSGKAAINSGRLELKMKNTKEYKDKVLRQPLEIINELVDVFGPEGPGRIADIGACDGLSSIKYAMVFPKTIISAFEPRKDNFEEMEMNIKIYRMVGRIVPRMVALSDKEEERVEFWESYGQAPGNPDHDTGIWSSSLLEPKEHLKQHTWCMFRRNQVFNVTTLDTLHLKEFDFIHIDVQGAELKVFKGAVGSLKSVKAIWCEVANIELYKGQPMKKDIINFLTPLGFKVKKDTCGDKKFGDVFFERK